MEPVYITKDKILIVYTLRDEDENTKIEILDLKKLPNLGKHFYPLDTFCIPNKILGFERNVKLHR